MRLMMLIAVLVLLLVTFPFSADAYDVLVLQSSRATAYDEALKGIRSTHRFSERLLVLSDYIDVDLHRIVREDHPLLIIALGDNAYTAARKVREVSVVVLMAPNYRGSSGGHPTLTGIELYLPPERYLAVFRSMKLRRIGIVGNPGKSGHYILTAQQMSARYGVELIVREVSSSREVPAQLDSLRDKVDALWLLPDDTAVTRETTDAYFLFSMQYQVPVVAFSGAYLQSGAAIAVEISRFDIGRQAGELVSSLLSGDHISDHPPESPRKSLTRTNPTILRRLGLVYHGSVSREWEGK